MTIKYHNLYLDFAPSWEVYHKISSILGLTPVEHTATKWEKTTSPSIWHYQVIETEEAPAFDFVHEFLSILIPKFTLLEELGIQRTNILIWLVYEYEQQCALEFAPKEMLLLGEHGISLNIDCHQKK